MPRVYEGEAGDGADRIAIVVSRYHDDITSLLLAAAETTLHEHGVIDDHIDVVWVPGAWEIPVAAAAVARSQSYCAVITLGCIIRGETTHDQHISHQVSRTVADIAVETGVPIAFGILTCQTPEQAIHRSGGSMGNKGTESALAALQMVSLLRRLANDVASHDEPNRGADGAR